MSISGNRLPRDGVFWVPHAVQLEAFVAPPVAQKPPFTAVYAHYSTVELAAIKAWGADSICFQISQLGADPQSSLYDPAFVQKAVGAVKAARSLGLNVIVVHAGRVAERRDFTDVLAERRHEPCLAESRADAQRRQRHRLGDVQ